MQNARGTVMLQFVRRTQLVLVNFPQVASLLVCGVNRVATESQANGTFHLQCTVPHEMTRHGNKKDRGQTEHQRTVAASAVLASPACVSQRLSQSIDTAATVRRQRESLSLSPVESAPHRLAHEGRAADSGSRTHSCDGPSWPTSVAKYENAAQR